MTEEQDWRATVDQQLFSQETRGPRRSMAVNYPDALFVLILEAAKHRGMSMTAFQRRASLSFAQYDLGFDWATELADELPIATFVGGRSGVSAHGFGPFGPWRIAELREFPRG